MNLYRLLYKSSAVNLMRDSELSALAKQARFNNLIHQVSGLLVYSNQRFYQVLEGSNDHIDFIYKKIEKDPRHTHVSLLVKEPIQERTFWRWNLGMVTINENNDIYLQLVDYINENLLLKNANIDDAGFIFEAFSREKFQKYIT
ncbi:MAG: BLUF domain-containing protein [Legionella sp.]|nr:BLUF domain-containing protein [Legionella sp.]